MHSTCYTYYGSVYKTVKVGLLFARSLPNNHVDDDMVSVLFFSQMN